VFSIRVQGKQRWESFPTYEAAKKAKQARHVDIDRGEFSPQSRITLHEYSREWVKRYKGRGRRGFREDTRTDYASQLERYVLREGIIRSNPARDVDLPHRPKIEEDDEGPVKVLTTEQLATFLQVVPPRHRLFFELLAATGLRISEAIALRWRDVQLDGSSPCVKVRRRIVRGKEGPPKSKYGRRDVPITFELVRALREHRSASEWHRAEDFVFATRSGNHFSPSNLRRDALVPAAQEADATWMGFHTLRHTCASLLFARGANAVQVQRWLGHHSAAFTLATYVHLLDGDLGEPLDLASMIRSSVGAVESEVPAVE
jgi:integrase